MQTSELIDKMAQVHADNLREREKHQAILALIRQTNNALHCARIRAEGVDRIVRRSCDLLDESWVVIGRANDKLERRV